MSTPQQFFDMQNKLFRLRRDAEERDAKRRAELLGYPYVDLSRTPISFEAVKLLPETVAHDTKAAAIQVKLFDMAIAVYDPRLPKTKQLIEDFKKRKFNLKIYIASESGLAQTWKFYEYIPPTPEHITGDVTIEKKKYDELINRFKFFPTLQKEIESTDFEHTTTSQFFEYIIAGAIASGASDIHFEAEEDGARIRYRMDGILHDVHSGVPLHMYGNIISRIKLLSELKMNIRDEAQDGRFTIKLSNKETEVRVSIIPAEFGETIVMRILDPDAISVSLEDLGLRADDFAIVQSELQRPNGLILNTGPTGSGKTTTLYAFLKRVSTPELKVITVEDPIEYRLDGIEQTQVDPEAGYTFASGLRSILRQDPDCILVGEIRDAETADIALQAALTGHLVFSTLHTNDAVGAVPRLVDLGVKPATIGPALSLIIAQRLVRKLCKNCKKTVPTSPELKAKLKTFLSKIPSRVDRAPYEALLKDDGVMYQPAGCAACNGFGYKGRIGIFEFLHSDSEFEEAVTQSVSELSLKKLAAKQEMVTMQQDGILKTFAGQTTLEEVESVTGPLRW